MDEWEMSRRRDQEAWDQYTDNHNTKAAVACCGDCPGAAREKEGKDESSGDLKSIDWKCQPF